MRQLDDWKKLKALSLAFLVGLACLMVIALPSRQPLGSVGQSSASLREEVSAFQGAPTALNECRKPAPHESSPDEGALTRQSQGPIWKVERTQPWKTGPVRMMIEQQKLLTARAISSGSSGRN